MLRLQRRLFGDGQPGLLSNLERRIARLERFHLIGVGVLVAISVMLQLMALLWRNP